MIKIKRGLCLPIIGEPEPAIGDDASPTSIALLGGDYFVMKPTMAV